MVKEFSELPVYVRKALNAASGINRCYVNNSQANEFLIKTFGLFTDDNECMIENFGKINFDWKVEKFYVM